MAQRKQRRSGPAEYAYYHFEIIGWDWNYSFSINAAKWEEKRFSDYRHLLVWATVLRPRRLSAPAAELCFLPNVLSEEFEPTWNQSLPPSVGSLSVEGSKSEGRRLMGYLSMPQDALEPVLQMLIAGRFKYVLMHGERMRWRKCLVRRYEFTAQHDEADYPDDD